MEEKKVRRRARRKKTEAVQLSEKDQKHFEESMKDADDETKTEWLKRRALEDAVLKQNKKPVDIWFEKKGSKLVRKTRRPSGGVTSNYVGNYVRNPEILTKEVQENMR